MFLGGGGGVVVEVVDGEEITWGKVDIEFAGELTRLLGGVLGRREEENVPVFGEELCEELRGKVGAIAWRNVSAYGSGGRECAA